MPAGFLGRDTVLVGLVSWLVELVAEDGATSVAGRVGSHVVGDAEERAIEKALRNACQVVAQDVADSENAERATDILLEHVTGAAPHQLRAGSPLVDLEDAMSEAVACLWTESVPDGSESHAQAIGLTCSAEELVQRLVEELVRSLGVMSPATSSLGALVALLGTERNRRDIAELRDPAVTSLARAGSDIQATRVNAWVAVNDDMPVVYVMNDSDAPIFEVRPTPALIGYDENGDIAAEVGHSPLKRVHQVDPHGGWAWPMTHCRGWGGVPYVRGQVHVHFSDASGQPWLLGHDRLVPEADPWSTSPTDRSMD